MIGVARRAIPGTASFNAATRIGVNFGCSGAGAAQVPRIFTGGQDMIIFPSTLRKDRALNINAYLIEDNALIRETLVAALQEMTHVRVLGFAETEAHGVALLRASDDWHLAIVDIFLKQGNGLHVVAAMVGRKPEQKVVVLTNYATESVRKQCRGLGADGVFDKSTELDGLIEYCRNLSVPPQLIRS